MCINTDQFIHYKYWQAPSIAAPRTLYHQIAFWADDTQLNPESHANSKKEHMFFCGNVLLKACVCPFKWILSECACWDDLLTSHSKYYALIYSISSLLVMKHYFFSSSLIHSDMCIELLFPSPPLSVPLMPLIHAESNLCSTDTAGLLGTNKTPNECRLIAFAAVTRASLHPTARALSTWATGLPILGVPGDFASVSSVQSSLSRGKLMLPKITVVQWRHQLLPHQLVSLWLWEHQENLQEIFVQWRLQT